MTKHIKSLVSELQKDIEMPDFVLLIGALIALTACTMLSYVKF